MPMEAPSARLGIILSSANWTLETCFRAFAPPSLGLHVTRMRMGSGGGRPPADIDSDILRCATLLADVKPDLIDLQGTGIMMERGPEGEAALVSAIENATGIATYTATQAAVEALRALGIGRPVLVGPYGKHAIERESAYLEAVGFSVAGAAGLERGDRSDEVAPAEWVDSALAHDTPDADGFFLSGSNTRMVEAIPAIEEKTGKRVVTSIQAALWAALRRLAPKIGPVTPTPALGRLFDTG